MHLHAPRWEGERMPSGFRRDRERRGANGRDQRCGEEKGKGVTEGSGRGGEEGKERRGSRREETPPTISSCMWLTKFSRVYVFDRKSRAHAMVGCAAPDMAVLFYKYNSAGNHCLEPLAEVEGALLVVEVLHAPHPELGGLLLVGGEHCCCRTRKSIRSARWRPSFREGNAHVAYKR
jgi:hypothetical protein